MGLIYQPLYPIALRVRGAIAKTYIFREYRTGRYYYKYYYPYNPRTLLQQTGRNLFAYAVADWQGFNETTKGYYNGRVRYVPMTGFNYYISLYLQANRH